MGGVMKTCVVKFIRKGDAGDPAVTYRIQLLSATAHVDTDKVMRGAITWNVIKEVSGVETYINSSTGTHQCKLSSASSWSTAGSSGNNFNDNGLINGVSFSTAGSPTHLLIRFVLGGNVKCTLAVGISVDGVKGDFKSIVFKRTNTTPVSTPSGGTYDSPVPSGWSDSIPSGQAKLWASECTFYGAGGSSGWSTPRQMTDTDTYDVEFSDVDQNPGTPSTNPSNWFDPDTDTSKDFTQMLWRAERECINGTWGSWTVVRIKGEKGDKGDGVNPNILLRTIFDRGIGPVKEAWTSNWSYVGIDGASDTVVQGRKSIRINATNAGSDVDFQQNVYGRIKVSTWYTLSFNVFATAAWHFFIYNGTNSTSVIDLSAGYIIDGEAVSTSAIDGRIVFASEWAGTRHSITFKTRSNFSNTNANILFRCLSGKQLAICMPKLEEGKVATAYVAHEDDQKGDQGNPSTVPGPRGYRGPALRGPQDWAQMEVGFQFYKGDADTQEPYEDFVVYNGTYYKCKKTHTKTTTNYPGSTADTNNGYWELTTKVGIVAANILFGDHGYFGSAIISGDWLISTNGKIDGVDYTKNDTYNGLVPYSLFNPNNPVGKTLAKFSSSETYTMAASDTTKNIGTVTLEKGKVYKLVVIGKCGSSSGQYYIRLRNVSNGTTNTPVMINGTSDITRSGVFTANYSGSYYIEFYDTSGLTGTVKFVDLSEMNFAPEFALDLLTGQTYQHGGVFTGFVRKGLTSITTSNINSYKRKDIATADTVLDFDKCGSFIELNAGTQSYFAIPILSNYLAGKYTEDQKNLIRSFVGTKLMVYNKTGSTINITYNTYYSTTDKTSSTAGVTTQTTSFGNNYFMLLECKLGVDPVNSDENVYWQEISSGKIV